MIDPQSFGPMLKAYRKAGDLTQEQLAEKVNYSVETIKKIEAGKLRPGKQLAERLADYLELGMEERAAFLTAARAAPRPSSLTLPTPPVERSVDEAGASTLAVTTKRSLIQGTLTFLFTDIEGSTQLWELHPKLMPAALVRHDALLRESIEAYGGVIFKTSGDGVHAVFARAPDALAAALTAQRALSVEPWGASGSVRVRMALHTGIAEERDDDYFGPPLNRVARLLAVGHGGQVLLSRVTQELVRDALPPAATLRDLGEHRLRDLTHPEHIFQLVAPDLPADFPPLRTFAIQPTNMSALLPSLIGTIVETVGDTALLRKMSVSQKRNGSSRTPIIVVLIVAATIIIGIFSGVLPAAPTTPTRELLQKIEFNYPDSPINHGWRLLDYSTPVTFTQDLDGYQGNYLIIQSDGPYSIDTDVLNAAVKGTSVEFLAKYSAHAPPAPIYARVKLKGQNGNKSMEGWVKVYSGTKSPKQVDPDEWTIYIEPVSLEGGWKLFQIDLREAVKNTFGNEGWEYDQLIGFRVRGNMSLVYIAIYE